MSFRPVSSASKGGQKKAGAHGPQARVHVSAGGHVGDRDALPGGLVNMCQFLDCRFEVRDGGDIGHDKRRQAILQGVCHPRAILQGPRFLSQRAQYAGELVRRPIGRAHHQNLLLVDRGEALDIGAVLLGVIRRQAGQQTVHGFALFSGHRYLGTDIGTQVNFCREGGVGQRWKPLVSGQFSEFAESAVDLDQFFRIPVSLSAAHSWRMLTTRASSWEGVAPRHWSAVMWNREC